MINAVDFDLFKKKERHLKLSLGAMRQIEIKLGMSIEYLLQNNSKFGYNALIVILSEGLKHEDPTMTDEKVTQNIEWACEQPGMSMPIFLRLAEAKILEAMKASGLFGELFEKIEKLANDEDGAELIQQKNEIAETVEN